MMIVRDSLVPFPWIWCLPSSLVGTHKLACSNYVPCHGFFYLSLCWSSHFREYLIKGIKFMEVSVPANRRARAPISLTIPIIEAFQSIRRKVSRLNGLLNTAFMRRYVIKYPVYPCHLRCPWIRCVWIIHYQNQALCLCRQAFPGKRR